MGKNRSTILKIEDMSVTYGPVKAVQNANLEIKQGEIVVLLGANGAGKSTLLKAILGIERPEKGKIFFKGKDITHMSTDRIVASGITLLPEGRGILPKMLVWENLQLGGYYSKRNVIKKNMDDVCNRFSILKDRKIQVAGNLSGGEQQILSIGRGMMAKPELMMLDEPSLGLAPKIVAEVFDIVIELKREGYSILLSEQNAHKALQIADHGYVFEKGRIVLKGSAEDLRKNEKVQHAYLGGFV